MKSLVFIFLSSLALSIVLGKILLPILKKIKAGQTVLKYVENHKEKNGTPTMGGLIFIVSASLIFIIFDGLSGRLATVSLTIGLAFFVVGFLDDFIKIKRKDNQGLKAYQKIIFQLGISILAGVFCYKNELTIFYVPLIKTSIDLGIWTIFIVSFIFIAITNSVNLTDGLDSLAGSVSCVYLVVLVVLIILQMQIFQVYYTNPKEYENIIKLCIALIGGILGFLVYNVFKAKVFMGDTGSLFLGGIIGAVSIFTLNTFFIPLIGIMFVTSSISVIIQVLHFKLTKKRIFLMAPIHHHFQLKGYSEAQISYVYSLITLIFGLIAIVGYL